jgi:hypothetical protein
MVGNLLDKELGFATFIVVRPFAVEQSTMVLVGIRYSCRRGPYSPRTGFRGLGNTA